MLLNIRWNINWFRCLNLNENKLIKIAVLIQFHLLTDRLAESRHANYLIYSDTYNHKESSNDCITFWKPCLGFEDKRCQRIGQGLVYVPNKHGEKSYSVHCVPQQLLIEHYFSSGSDEKSGWILEHCGWVFNFTSIKHFLYSAHLLHS